MRLASKFTLTSALLLATASTAFASPHTRRGPTAPRLVRTHASRAAARPVAPRISISSDRATEIQTALIKQGYLIGTPSGQWDASSQAAMEKLQADNGWQTKLVPDSRAIIKLGLGPHNTATAPAANTSAEATEAPTTPELRSANR